MSDNEPPNRSKGATYEHDDGTVDTVFYNDGERILVVREFPSHDHFDRSIASATYRGTNELVETLQDPSEDEGHQFDGA